MLDPRPAFVFDALCGRILWTNPPGADVFGETIAEVVRTPLAADNPVVGQIVRVAQRLKGDAPMVAILRIAMGGRSRTLTARCQLVAVPGGGTAVLAVEAMQRGEPESLERRAERLTAALAEAGAAWVVSGSDGRVVAVPITSGSGAKHWRSWPAGRRWPCLWGPGDLQAEAVCLATPQGAFTLMRISRATTGEASNTDKNPVASTAAAVDETASPPAVASTPARVAVAPPDSQTALRAADSQPAASRPATPHAAPTRQAGPPWIQLATQCRSGALTSAVGRATGLRCSSGCAAGLGGSRACLGRSPGSAASDQPSSACALADLQLRGSRRASALCFSDGRRGAVYLRLAEFRDAGRPGLGRRGRPAMDGSRRGARARSRRCGRASPRPARHLERRHRLLAGRGNRPQRRRRSGRLAGVRTRPRVRRISRLRRLRTADIRSTPIDATPRDTSPTVEDSTAAPSQLDEPGIADGGGAAMPAAGKAERPPAEEVRAPGGEVIVLPVVDDSPPMWFGYPARPASTATAGPSR